MVLLHNFFKIINVFKAILKNFSYIFTPSKITIFQSVIVFKENFHKDFNGRWRKCWEPEDVSARPIVIFLFIFMKLLQENWRIFLPYGSASVAISSKKQNNLVRVLNNKDDIRRYSTNFKKHYVSAEKNLFLQIKQNGL